MLLYCLCLGSLLLFLVCHKNSQNICLFYLYSFLLLFVLYLVLLFLLVHRLLLFFLLFYIFLLLVFLVYIRVLVLFLLFSNVFIDLWLIMLKFLIESISSPQNSTLTPIASFIDMSSIPPLRLNCPLPSIKSHLVYPKFTKSCFIFSNECISPTLNFNVFFV